MTPEKTTANERKNVIILWNYINWGGAQIYLLSIVKHAPAVWNFKLVVPRRSSSEVVDLFKKHGAEVEYRDVLLETNKAVSPLEKIKRQWSRIYSEISTYRYIRRQQSMENTVLHVETAPWQSWLFIKMLAGRIDVFVTMHNSLPAVSSLRQKIWRFRLRYVSKLSRFHLFTSNRDTKDSLKGWVTDDFWEKIKVTYTCVDPTEIEKVLRLPLKKDDLRRRFSIPEDKLVVLCVGQFIDRKGRKIYLEAAKKLSLADPDIQFLWLTQTELDEADEKLIESFDLGDAFRLIRSDGVGKERLDVLSFFLVADIFVLPSYVEGLPIALLEAMALGIPSVSTRVNAIPEAIKHDETGLLVSAGNSRELADAIRRLDKDQALRQRVSEAGRKYVIEKFDERVCAKTVLESYEAALNAGRQD